MGVLSASGAMDGGGAPPPAEPEAPAPEAPEGQSPPPAEPEDAAAPSDYQPARRRTKREVAIEEQITTRLTDLEKRLAAERQQERQTWQDQLAEAHRRAAVLEGRLHEVANRPAPAAQPPENRPDPADLRRQARKALDDKNFDEYERLTQSAILEEADRRLDARLGKVRTELEGKIPQQIPAEIQYLMAKHQHVALAGPRGVQAVQIKDAELGLYGQPMGPDRLAKAFELADKMLTPRQTPQRPAYSQDAAAALAAVPAGRPAGGGGGAGHEAEPLTPLEKATARSAGMSEDDYRKWRTPEKFIRR